VNKQATFTIDARDVAKSKTDDGKVSCTINNPSGGKTEKLITPQGDGTYRVSYTPFEEGCHTIDILYDNVPIPGSPFSVNVQRGSNPSKCRAYGPGLERGIVNKTNRFTVETRGQ
jgi:filamin